jgi:NTE family protein
VSQIAGYPPPAQVLGLLYNAVFLDLIDQDILRLELINQMLSDVPEAHRNGMRRVAILVCARRAISERWSCSSSRDCPKHFAFSHEGWARVERRVPIF